MEPDSPIYEWLKSHQTIPIATGGSYEIKRFQETIDLIDSLIKEIEELKQDRDRWRKNALSFTSYED